MMNRQKLVTLISNTLLAVGAGLSILAIVLTVTVRASLPSGVCPVDSNRPLYFTAIGMLIASFALSIYADRLKKRTNKHE